MGRSGSFGPSADARNISIRLKKAKVVKNCLKSAFVPEITRIKMSKKGDLLSLCFALFHIALTKESEMRSRKTRIGCVRTWLGLQLSLLFIYLSVSLQRAQNAPPCHSRI